MSRSILRPIKSPGNLIPGYLPTLHAVYRPYPKVSLRNSRRRPKKRLSHRLSGLIGPLWRRQIKHQSRPCLRDGFVGFTSLEARFRKTVSAKLQILWLHRTAMVGLGSGDCSINDTIDSVIQSPDGIGRCHHPLALDVCFRFAGNDQNILLVRFLLCRFFPCPPMTSMQNSGSNNIGPQATSDKTHHALCP